MWRWRERGVCLRWRFAAAEGGERGWGRGGGGYGHCGYGGGCGGAGYLGCGGSDKVWWWLGLVVWRTPLTKIREGGE